MSDHIYVLSVPDSGFVKVANTLARSKIDATDLKVLLYLLTHDTKFSVKKASMATALGLDRKTVNVALDRLEDPTVHRKRSYSYEARHLVRQAVVKDGEQVGTNYFVSGYALSDEQVRTYSIPKAIGKGESSESVVAAVDDGESLHSNRVPTPGKVSRVVGKVSRDSGESFRTLEDQENTNLKEDQDLVRAAVVDDRPLSSSDGDSPMGLRAFLGKYRAELAEAAKQAGANYGALAGAMDREVIGGDRTDTEFWEIARRSLDDRLVSR